MKKFKIHQGVYEAHNISRENFEKLTKNKEPYCQNGKDGTKRYFGICPACDNPIVLVGLYTKDESFRPYGKHSSKGVKKSAPHNEQAYQFCPYAIKNYSAPLRTDLRKNVTDFERSIYYTVRNYFDKVIYILQQDTGILISETFAREILKDYLASRGWMYRWAALYNIPWIVLYMRGGFSPYGKFIRKESDVWKWTADEKNIILVDGSVKGFAKLTTAQFARYNFMFWKHRRQLRNDEISETIDIEISKETPNGWKTLAENSIAINENRFLHLISSEEALKIRDQRYLDIAKEMMPDI